MGLLSGGSPWRTVAIAAAVSLGAFAVGLGLALDARRASSPMPDAPAIQASEAGPTAQPATPGSGTLPGLEVMVGRLEAKLRDGGGTAEQWRLLGQTYLELGRTADAQQAFARAATLDPAASRPKTDPAPPPR